MNRPLTVIPTPARPPAETLVAVDRAIADLRRGAILCLTGEAPVLLIAAEAVTDETLARLTALGSEPPSVAVTGRRAEALGWPNSDRVTRLKAAGPMTARLVQAVIDPLSDVSIAGLQLHRENAPAWAIPAVAVVKLARLLPAALVVPIPADQPLPDGVLTVTADQVGAYPQASALGLRVVTEARVPLADAEQCRVVAFRPSDGGIEHLALIIGDPDRDAPVLTRIHSECFTGDLLGSLRCDCGDQLKSAIAVLADQGGGVLLYLAQEGRGIGLVNKLRAYNLQDDGFDTLDANLQLGFDDDERAYLPAAEMLRLLGIDQVRLLTNNPRKVEGLARHDVQVVERVPHVIPANSHNRFYLATKATRSGHLFSAELAEETKTAS